MLWSKIIVRVSQEWVLQQAQAHNLLPKPDHLLIYPPSQAHPLPHTAAVLSPAPFPMAATPPPAGISKQAQTDLLGPSPMPDVREGPHPSIGLWGLWKLPNCLYYPAEVINVCLNTCTATLHWLEPIPLTVSATFHLPFIHRYDALDSEYDLRDTLLLDQLCPIPWPWARDTRNLEASQVNKEMNSMSLNSDLDLMPAQAALLDHLRLQFLAIVDIIMGASTKFATLMAEWHEWHRTNIESDFKLSYVFFSGHCTLLDDIERFIIESQCAHELAHLLRDRMLSMDGLNESNLTFGPGCAILGYCTIGYNLGISGEEAFELVDQGLLLRELSPHEQAWEAMQQRLLMPIQVALEFERSHRIPDFNLELPPVQKPPGPLRQNAKISSPLATMTANNGIATSENVSHIAVEGLTSASLSSGTTPTGTTSAAATSGGEVDTATATVTGNTGLLSMPSLPGKIPKLIIRKTRSGLRVEVADMPNRSSSDDAAPAVEKDGSLTSFTPGGGTIPFLAESMPSQRDVVDGRTDKRKAPEVKGIMEMDWGRRLRPRK